MSIKIDEVVVLAHNSGSVEAYSAGGLRRDFSFSGPELLVFAEGILSMAKKCSATSIDESGSRNEH